MERVTVSIIEATHLVHVSRRTIYNWLNDKKISFIRTAGGAVRIYRDTLWRDELNNPVDKDDITCP